MTATVVAAPRRRRARPALWAATAVGVTIALLVAVLATRDPATDRLVGSPLLGKPAPEVAGTSLSGRQVRLSTMGGRWVLVNFFATWCVPCVREHPELRRFSQQGNATVLAVIYSDAADRVRRFFAERGGSWPVVADPEGRVALDYGVRGVPESFLVAPDGTVVRKITGGVTAAGLRGLLREASGG